MSQADRLERPQGEAFEEAWRILTRTNPLPAICGRVCPHPCEGSCNLCDKGCGVAVHEIERFLGDWAILHDLPYTKLSEASFPGKIAVIGAGPAGLACAYHLALHGYKVTIFEALPKPGGMLRYGIPEYRLPGKVIDAEVQKILDLGVELQTGVSVGKDVSFEELKSKYNAVFIGIGAQKGIRLFCKGEDAHNVFSGVEFLRRAADDKSIELGKHVIVVGGGDTAIDAARTARRLGSDVTILYRRTRVEMPAIEDEIVEAEAEGVDIQFLAAPLEIATDGDRTTRMSVQRMELGEPDESGRRWPIPISGEEYEVNADAVIVAVSQATEWAGLEGLLNHRGWIDTDDWGSINGEKIYAGGDVRGLGWVTGAISQGTRAAEAIHARLRKADLPETVELPVVTNDRIAHEKIRLTSRQEGHKTPVEERWGDLWAEIKSTLSVEEAVDEANRCLKCGTTFLKKKTTPLMIVRRISQIGIGTLLLNSYFAVFNTKIIYAGPLRNVCVPGLNCHSCPTALMGCPIGMMQHFSATHRFPWFLIGFLAIIGLLSGRFTCGWLCPFGLVQDAMHWFKKINIRIPRFLNYFKYAVLVGVVLIIPYFTYEHWFSKLCPCGALIAAIPWAIWNPVNPDFGVASIPPDAIGAMFWIKMWILGFFLLLFLFIRRPFCRTVCPLGATYALFNRISLVSLKVTDDCTNCGRCREVCPMDLEVQREVNSENCIKCLDCTQCEHVKFTWNLPWRKSEVASQKSKVASWESGGGSREEGGRSWKSEVGKDGVGRL